MKKVPKNFSLETFVRPNGRNERIRTSDPFVPNEVRYQAAPHSELFLLPAEADSILTL